VLSSSLKGGAVDPDFVIFKCVKIKPIRELALNDGQVLVNKGGTPEPIEDLSRFLGAVGKAGAGIDVEIYAPVEWQGRDNRDALCDKLKSGIKDAIEAAIKEEASGHDII